MRNRWSMCVRRAKMERRPWGRRSADRRKGRTQPGDHESVPQEMVARDFAGKPHGGSEAIPPLSRSGHEQAARAHGRPSLESSYVIAGQARERSKNNRVPVRSTGGRGAVLSR